MAEGNTKVLQVLVAEVRKDGNINVVIGKELGVLLKPKLPKPRRDLLHGSPPRFSSHHRVTLALEARQGTSCISAHRHQIPAWSLAISSAQIFGVQALQQRL